MKKQCLLSIILSLGLIFSICQYYEAFKIQDVSAVTVGVPNPGHSLAQLECSADSFCVDTTNNRVGIGTASPTTKFEVNGIITTQRGINFGATNLDSVTGTEYLENFSGLIGANYYAGNAEMDFFSPAYDGGTIAFAFLKKTGTTSPYGVSSLAAITRSGNVGIGTTAPGGVLDIRTGGAATWDRFVVTNTSQWGDGTTPYVTIGAGGAVGIMINNPHVVWNAGNGSAAIRMGRSGGVSTGSYYDIGTRAGDAWSIQKNGSETGLFYINSLGYIGVGTTNPLDKLYVVGDTSGVDVFNNDGNDRPGISVKGAYPELNLISTAYSNGSHGATLRFVGYKDSSRNTWNHWVIGTSGNATNLDFGYSSSSQTNPHCGIADYCAGTFMRITPSGSVGIGTTSPSYTLTVAGTAWVTSGAWSGSDVRWKKNINTLSTTSSLDQILKLNPVNYEWRTDEFPDMKFTIGTQLGFIAQDMEKVIPEVVTTDNNGYKGISYEKIVPVLTSAMQEQQKEIEVQQTKINVLEENNKQLKTLVCLDHPSADICK